MHCHNLSNHLKIPAGSKKIVLAGNLNVGKSVFFNALTGLYVDVSNYPGTTLEISHGTFGEDVIIDTPGVYGVSSFNDEEMVARDVIIGADLVVNIVDAVHLDRDLFLTLQIIDMGLPVVVALNMVDEAEKHGLQVDVRQLEELLGVPVIPTVAVKNQGIDELKKRIYEARKGKRDPWLERHLKQLEGKVDNEGEALLVLEGDPHVARRHNLVPGEMREEIYLRRRQRVNEIVEKVVTERGRAATWSTRLGKWMIHPLTGIPLLAVTLWLMYEIIGVFIAQTVVGITEEQIMQGLYEPAVKAVVGRVVGESTVLGTILIGEFGLLTMTVTYILGLLLPLVVGFYFALSTLEDSGYLPRIAVLTDRVLTTIGLNGRAIIPIILGFGCVTMATITTRLLGSERERRIAIFLLALAIPCSAQMAVIIAMLSGLGIKYVAIYVATILTVLVIVGTLLNRIMPGRSTELLIDLPALRFPRWSNVLRKTFTKSWSFLREATPLFAIGALIIGVMQVTGLLETIQNLLAPLTVGWLKLPKETATAFIMGFVRRDFGAAGLYDLNMPPEQTVVAVATITMFVPCIASAMVIFKERGRREAVAIWLSVLVIAFLVGGILARLIG
ncbi:ferrous iron transport protein B [Calderihabitans maritimus]|uniref:Ferrous iron transport protein B n=1 Tax=Calderihabitans maritimus TaxID=1246530 RepID=A0A1Z5HQR6_9FIRM|nr:ferrous iron transport protein B [Calderihabitans maritimus]GAW91869.1 ferrous iron transport protein B [Calderihabitans maritimus]